MILEITFYFFSTFRKITVGGFVNQLIKIFWPYNEAISIINYIRYHFNSYIDTLSFLSVCWFENYSAVEHIHHFIIRFLINP